MDDDELTAPRHWPLVIALLATLIWLVCAVLAVANALLPGGLTQSIGFDPAAVGGVITVIVALAPPLALLWLVATALRERFGARARAAARLAASLDESDRRIAAARETLETLNAGVRDVAVQIETAAAALLDQALHLDAAGERWTRNAEHLSAAADTAAAAGASLVAAAPDALGKAEQLAALLAGSADELRRQLTDGDAMLASMRAHLAAVGGEAMQRAAEAAGSMDAVTAAGGRAVEALRQPAQVLSESVDAAFIKTAAAMDASRDGVHAQTSALLASVEQARVTLDQIGGEAARQIGRRLETLLQAAHDLGEQLDAQNERTREMIDGAERGLGVLDAKLGNSVKVGNGALDGMTARIGEARDAVQRLTEPLADATAALLAVEARVAAVGSSADLAIGALGDALPATLPVVDELSARLEALHARVHALAAPIASGQDVIAQADARLGENRLALEAAAGSLNRELATARTALVDIETLTGNASLAASTQLIDVFVRVREIAEQTAGTMRTTLHGVIAEAETALDKAGSARAEAAFAAPVRQQLGQIEAATERATAVAQEAAERITQRLFALTETVATVEARIGEADAQQDLRLRNDVINRSGTLIASLQAAAVDIAKLLALDVPDGDWRRYLKGDRSIFTRRTVRLIDASTARLIARHFEHDETFRGHAIRYIEEFELLIHRVETGRDGDTLALTLLSSDIGKLYVALAQGSERLR